MPPIERQPSPSPEPEVPRDPYDFDISDDEDTPEVTATTNLGRSTQENLVVPPFWGVVRTSDLSHAPWQREYERDNSMHHMLSGDVYYSRRSNSVFAGLSAREALEYERSHEREFSPFTRIHNNQLYVRSPRGLPLIPDHVKKLVTLYKGDFAPRERAEAYQILTELYNIARQVTPEHCDASMNYILQPSVFHEDLPPYYSFRLTRSMPQQPPGSTPQAPQTGEVMNIEALGLHLLLYNRLGSANPAFGLAMDYAFRVGRRSLFGYALCRLLSPTGRHIGHVFRRHYAFLLARPRRYREAIMEYNRANPQRPFVSQIGPIYTTYCPRMNANDMNNFSENEVIQTLIDNQIPPEWVDHAYPFGVIYLNSHYSGSPLNQGTLDPIDNEHIARVLRFGIPPAIAGWDGWRHPTEAEVLRLHDIMDVETPRPTRQGGDASDRQQGLRASSWLLVGQDGVVEYLTHRPQSIAEEYHNNHSFLPPDYDKLNAPPNMSLTLPPSSNLLGGSSVTTINAPANTGTHISSSATTSTGLAVDQPDPDTVMDTADTDPPSGTGL